MRDLVYEYLLAYYWHGVSDRNLKDLCRELVEFEPEEASPDERQKMVDEACRVAVLASDEAEKFEDIANQLKAELSKHDGDDDFLDSIDFMLNAVAEDGERANSFTKEVTNLNLGGEPRTPRKPRVANPFLPIIRAEREAEEENPDDEILDELAEEIAEDEEEECEESETEEESAEDSEEELAVSSPASDGTDTDEETGDGGTTGPEEGSEGESEGEEGEKSKPFNPLAEETERILNGEEVVVDDGEDSEQEHEHPLADESETILDDGEAPDSEESDTDSEIRSRLTGGSRRNILGHLGDSLRRKTYKCDRTANGLGGKGKGPDE